MKDIQTNETPYKPGDLRKAIGSTHNYVPKAKEEIKVPYELLAKCKTPEEKWALLEKIVNLNSND